ncbi:hypothetical protein [Nocardia sp. NPDC050793]|uniref:hypothetical protein n=1 Tax=Nocardia sp. NPDC050793 TaxID=3155159 RepID=UPI0033F1EDCA
MPHLIRNCHRRRGLGVKYGRSLTDHSPGLSCWRGTTDPVSVAIRGIHTMATGSRADFDLVAHPDAVDRENKIQPPSSWVRGPAGFYSTASWLRADLSRLSPGRTHVIRMAPAKHRAERTESTHSSS